MAIKMTVVTSSGVKLEFASDMWRKVGNLLVIDYPNRKDNQGNPIQYGQFERWDAFMVEYTDD